MPPMSTECRTCGKVFSLYFNLYERASLNEELFSLCKRQRFPNSNCPGLRYLKLYGVYFCVIYWLARLNKKKNRKPLQFPGAC